MDNSSSPSPHFQRSEGLTPSEKILKRLGDRSFLSLWCYPNIYRDQGGGKEICDLLVVFENHILIFSDKSYQFPDTGNLELDWKRWFQRAIKKSADQIWGAERWIKSHPNRIFIDSACMHKFPIEVPDPQSAQFHRIVVVTGAAQRCKAVLGGDGSLMLDSNVIGDEHAKYPFTIGQIDPTKGFIHVLDESSLAIVMQTLDTITDFVGYLSKKEALFQRVKALFAAGETELLAVYLQDINQDGEHDFIIPSNINGLVYQEGFWEEFSQHPQRLAQLKANKESYLWDALIEQFSKHIFEGTQHFTTSSSISESEQGIRFLAKESRFRRRILSELFLDLLRKTPPIGVRGNQVFLPTRSGEPYYVFLLIPAFSKIPFEKSYEEYRQVRLQLLFDCCRIVKLIYPAAYDIVGIATESGADNEERSEDLAYLDARIWTAEDQNDAVSAQKELKIFTSLDMHHVRATDYPETRAYRSKKRHKIGRNDPCPCGSRKKYKYCCGKT